MYQNNLSLLQDEKNDEEPKELSVNDLLESFEEHCDTFVRNAYLATPQIHTIRSGKLMLSLATEVFSQVDVQMIILNEYLDKSHLSSTDAGTTLVIDMAHIIVNILSSNHYMFCGQYQDSLDMCCASANDYFRMSELVEKLTKEGNHFYKLSRHKDKSNYLNLAESVSALITQYSKSAVHAAQMTSSFVIDTFEDILASRLFDWEWEKNLTQNEVAISIIRTIDDYFTDIDVYLQNPFLSKKAMDAIVSGTVVFYTKCLLTKAKEIRNVLLKAKEKVREKTKSITPKQSEAAKQQNQKEQQLLRQKRRSAPFHDPQRAVNRIFGDIRTLKDYFKSFTERMPALTRMIEVQFAPLIAITECLGIAANSSKEDMNDFIFVLHKYTLDYHQTKHLARDLWYLVAPKKAPIAFQAVRERRNKLLIMSQYDPKRMEARVDKALEEKKPPGLSMTDLLIQLYGVSKKYHVELGPCDGACYSKESFLASAQSCGAEAVSTILCGFRTEAKKGRDRAFASMKITNEITSNSPLLQRHSSRRLHPNDNTVSNRSILPSEAALWTMAIKLRKIFHRDGNDRIKKPQNMTISPYNEEEINFSDDADEKEPILGITRFEI